MIYWKVQLSNGEVFTEGDEPLFNLRDGEKSAWLRLQDYLIDRKLEVIYLGLVVDGRLYSLPSDYNKPKFRSFVKPEKVEEYKWFKMIGSDLDGSKEDRFVVIEATYSDHKLQIWVDEDTKDCWTVVK